MVCILNKASYINEAYRQLNNTKYYHEMEEYVHNSQRQTTRIIPFNIILTPSLSHS